MRVIIAGGGIGGLACAQGLARRGFDVTVIEPDEDLSETAGYKLHLGESAVSALRDLLPAQGVEALLGVSAATHGFTLIVRDHRGRRLLRAAEATTELSLDVDRVTLRNVIAFGLDNHLVLGRRCEGWREEDESIAVVLDDGAVIRADVLVIADGAGSALAENLAGAPTSTSCGLIGIAGKTAWNDVPTEARDMLAHESMLAIGPGGTGVFAAKHDPVNRSALRTVLASPATIDPIVIWGLLALDGTFPGRPSRLHSTELLNLACELLRKHQWADPLIALLQRSDAESVGAFRLNAADPDHLAPWRSSRVTALGDAVHAMPPTGGQGAATAILDAHDLVFALAVAATGDVTPIVAIHDYEARLRERGARAVTESLEPLKWIRGAATPIGGLALRVVTPVIATAARLLRRPRR